MAIFERLSKQAAMSAIETELRERIKKSLASKNEDLPYDDLSQTDKASLPILSDRGEVSLYFDKDGLQRVKLRSTNDFIRWVTAGVYNQLPDFSREK